jgi:hypothetical protein
MRTPLILLVAVVLAGAATTAALADHKPGHPAKPAKAHGKGKAAAKKPKPTKIEICHRTMAGEDAHHTIRISDRAWPAHERHGDAKGACTGENNEPAGTRAVQTTLAPVSGATGSGAFHADVRLLKNDKARICYTLSVTGVEATAAHIHTVAAQDYASAPDVAANGIVVPLKTPDNGGLARGCTNVPREVAVDIRDNPAEYYVNVHSAAFPNGQVQGALTLDA